MLRVLTVSTQFAGMGGAEAILRRHHQQDAEHGLDSRFVVYWEPPDPEWPRAAFLNLDVRQSIRSARARFQSAHPTFIPDIAVYHTDWGWPFFSDLDRAKRRILYLHSDIPGLDRQLASRLGWVDGVICVSSRLVDRVQHHAPDLVQDRCLQVDAAIDPPPPDASPSSLRPPVSPEHPLVLGYCGRIVREQKRVDRLPPWIQLLQDAQIPFRLEILGAGQDRDWLESQLRPTASGQVVFLGRKSGPEYWSALARWDAIVFVSDYEGTPLALLEAMAQGAVPFHPKLDSGGDRYAHQVDPHCVYAPGDLQELTRHVAWLASQSPEQRLALRKNARATITHHFGDAYQKKFKDFLLHIQALPERNKQTLPTRPFPMDWLSFRAFETLGKWRRRLRGG